MMDVIRRLAYSSCIDLVLLKNVTYRVYGLRV